jgi:6-pyruvoyl-tetrahydropterin synthase
MIGSTIKAMPSRPPESGLAEEPTPTVWSGGEMLTGVSGHFSATHRTPEGKLHGHTWHVTAWFKNNFRSDARVLKAMLDTMLSRLDHTELPDDLTWGEDIARQIAVLANCQEVEISRPAERIHARWRWA